jgi:hypothetical protein
MQVRSDSLKLLIVLIDTRIHSRWNIQKVQYGGGIGSFFREYYERGLTSLRNKFNKSLSPPIRRAGAATTPRAHRASVDVSTILRVLCACFSIQAPPRSCRLYQGYQADLDLKAAKGKVPPRGALYMNGLKHANHIALPLAPVTDI